MTRRELLRTGPLALVLAPAVIVREATKPEPPAPLPHVEPYDIGPTAEGWNALVDRITALERQ